MKTALSLDNWLFLERNNVVPLLYDPLIRSLLCDHLLLILVRSNNPRILYRLHPIQDRIPYATASELQKSMSWSYDAGTAVHYFQGYSFGTSEPVFFLFLFFFVRYRGELDYIEWYKSL